MIVIKDLEIENYRSIIGNPYQCEFNQYNIIVGPNNCGKSNILRAMQLFFRGNVDGKPYDASTDFPRGITRGSRQQTRITMTLQFSPLQDRKIEGELKELEKTSGQQRLGNNLLRLRLQFTRTNEEQWRFISRAGVRSIRSELILPVVEAVRSTSRFKYLPVGRDILQTIRTELSDELIRTIFSGWSGAIKARREINQAIDVLIEKLQPRLSSSGEEITTAINQAFKEIKKLELRLPFNDLETLLPSLIPALKDSHETGLSEKGAGIQTSTLLFLLKYLADHHPQRHNKRITYIWALEEPESYLHPARQRAMSKVLHEFSKDVQTIITTHSPHFVPRDSAPSVMIVDKSDKPPYGTITVGNEYEYARQSLGVSLLDSMYLYPTNIVVEGPSDEILLLGAWKKLYEAGALKVKPSDVRFFPGKNAAGACTLFESLMIYGDSSEVNIFLMLDGDEAGKKALNGLLKRSGMEYKWKSNTDYFVLEKDIEWLASGRVMVQLSKERPAQASLTYNTSDEIIEFRVSDVHKKTVAKRMVELSEIEDLSDFEKVICKIERQILLKSSN